LLRGWYELGPKRRPPRHNPAAAQEWRDFLRKRVKGDNSYFGEISHEEWSGTFFKLYKHPRRWSTVSQLHITPQDWDRELPPLLKKIETEELKFIKRGNSGDVLAAQITLGGKEIDVVIKRPRHRYWYRHINGIWRGTRARREWFKAWKILVRNLPTAWPLLYIEKRKAGYVTDGLIIFERVPGPMLAWAKLDEIPPNQREMLFRRAGRILRRIDRLGFAHFDAKAANWIVRPDDKLGPMPVMIDIDGIRHRRWTALGIRRLLKSMQENKQYSVADSLALCMGYAPGALPEREWDDEEFDIEAVADEAEQE
jgi:tRNA A-37 threonylcarbamoyl transferase component Bud32